MCAVLTILKNIFISMYICFVLNCVSLQILFLRHPRVIKKHSAFEEHEDSSCATKKKLKHLSRNLNFSMMIINSFLKKKNTKLAQTRVI